MEQPTTPTTPTHMIGLDILGQHYDIVWIPQQFIPDRLGHSDAESQEIVLRANLRGMQALDTLIHEVTHAVSAITGVELTELQTHTIGYAWAQIFKTNPELLVFIAERLDEEASRDYQRRTRKNARGK